MSYCAKRKRKEEIIGSCIIVVYASDSSFLQLVCYSSSIQVPVKLEMQLHFQLEKPWDICWGWRFRRKGGMNRLQLFHQIFFIPVSRPRLMEYIYIYIFIFLW